MHYNNILDEMIYKFREELENESGNDCEESFTCDTINILDSDVYDRDEDFTNYNESKWRDGDLDDYVGLSL